MLSSDYAEDIDDVEAEAIVSEPTDCWDDGEECNDPPWSVLLWCKRCGNRPRPEHNFRCRLHDDTVSNGDSRPVAPAQPSNEVAELMSTVEWEAAMEAYFDRMGIHQSAMTRWEPHWLESTAEAAGASDAPALAHAYPLPCVRCAGPTQSTSSSKGMGFSTSLESLREHTSWLPDAFGDGLGSDRVRSNSVDCGICDHCELMISIHAGEEE